MMHSLSSLKILVVEDDPDLLEVVVEDFKMYGGNVEMATCGQTAIEMIHKNLYDVVLSDMRMPKGDGRFLAAQIKKINGPKPKLFLYSGYSDFSLEEARSLGIVEIYAKPYLASEMIESILTHLNRAIVHAIINQTVATS